MCGDDKKKNFIFDDVCFIIKSDPFVHEREGGGREIA